jgi:hypothetical protein
VAQGASKLTLTRNGHSVHIMPTVAGARALANQFADTGPLPYQGGPIVKYSSLYQIFWDPPTLQNGNPTSIRFHYGQVNGDLLVDYPVNGIDNNNT